MSHPTKNFDTTKIHNAGLSRDFGAVEHGSVQPGHLPGLIVGEYCASRLLSAAT
jgi:hypothetical protein